MNQTYNKKLYYAITFPCLVIWFMIFYGVLESYIQNAILYYVVLIAPILLITYVALRIAIKKS